MSIKIWEAYRIRLGHDPWDVMMDLKARATLAVKRDLGALYDAIIADARSKKPSILTAEETAKGDQFGYLDASRAVFRRYQAQIGKPDRNEWDLSVSMTVRRASARQYLVIPYPGSGVLWNALRFLRKHPALEDFHYQNQADRPAKIGAREWARRRDTWNPLLDEPRWSEHVVLDVVSVDIWPHVCPSFDLALRAARARKRA